MGGMDIAIVIRYRNPKKKVYFERSDDEG